MFPGTMKCKIVQFAGLIETEMISTSSLVSYYCWITVVVTAKLCLVGAISTFLLRVLTKLLSVWIASRNCGSSVMEKGLQWDTARKSGSLAVCCSSDDGV